MRCDTSSVDPDKLGGPDYPAPGSYHFEIEEVVEEDPQSGCMYAVCKVLAGDPAEQEGKIHREYFSLTEKAMGRIFQFAMAIGLTTEEAIKAAKQGGQALNLDFENDGPGRQFCGKLIEEEYQGKTRNKLNFNIWSLDDKKAKGIPLAHDKLKKPAPPATVAAGAGAGGSGNGSPMDGDDLF